MQIFLSLSKIMKLLTAYCGKNQPKITIKIQILENWKMLLNNNKLADVLAIQLSKWMTCN